MIKLRVDEGLFKVDLAPLERYVSWSPGARYFNLPPGKEHYKLLAYLASQLPPGSAVADCGTLYGCSAAALASNPNVEVETYDTVEHLPSPTTTNIDTINFLPNVDRHVGDCLKHVNWSPRFFNIKDSSLILLDIDPHDGDQEWRFFDALGLNGYKGILICDDINLNDSMRRFWSLVPAGYKRLDLTPWGHWSGTGAVVFDPNVIDLEVIL